MFSFPLSVFQTDRGNLLQKLTLFAIILLEGFVTISVEILTIRQVIPFVGHSVTVTSLIIGVFLLFLAYGYKKGGTYQNNHADKLSTNFTISAILLGVGLSYVFLDLFFMAFQAQFGNHLLLGLTAYLLLIIAPLIYFLGQTVPITMNMIPKDKPTGTIGGNVLHLSTIGSFLGAILTTLLLMHLFGVANTIYFNFCLLLGLNLLIFFTFKFHFLKFIILGIASFFIYKINNEFEQIAFIKTNHFANYQIFETETLYDTPGKVFTINNAHSSYINEDGKAFDYIEKIKTLLFDDLKIKNQDILVLGAGGFTLSAENTFDNQFTYVDIDPNIKPLVQKHFMPNVPDNVIISDARQFLLKNEKTWDVIISDTYSNRHEIPTHLVTQQYFELLKSQLKPGGYALFNIIAEPTLTSPYAKRLDNTLRATFKQCMTIPLHYKNEPANIIYACHKTTTPEDTTIYVDNTNHAEIDVAQR